MEISLVMSIVPAYVPIVAFGSVILVMFLTVVDWKDKQDILVGACFCGFLLLVVIAASLIP